MSGDEKIEKKKKAGDYLFGDHADTTAVALEAIAAGTFFSYALPEFFTSLKQAAKHARHATNTVVDAAKGGPEGMRAAKNLEEALQQVETAAATNQEAAQTLSSYYSARKEFATELVKIYKENETIGREASRVKLQLEGFVKSFFDAGDQLKPEFWKKMDEVIIKAYGKDPVKAREESAGLRKFYDEVEKFYSSREKNENTVKEFCDYLTKTKDKVEADNKKMDQYFPQIISKVKEGYEVEDFLFKKEHEGTKEKVDKYKQGVDKTRETLEINTGMKKYEAPASWIDYALNPITVGIAATLVANGAARFFMPRKLYEGMNKMLMYPFRLISNGLQSAGAKILYNSGKAK